MLHLWVAEPSLRYVLYQSADKFLGLVVARAVCPNRSNTSISQRKEQVMNKILLKSAICLTFGTILSLGFTLNAQAQIAKQGKFEMIGTYQLTYLDQNDFDGIFPE